VTAALWLAEEIILAEKYGFGEVFYPGLPLLIGFLSVGFAYYQREQALIAREKTQELLDQLRAAHQQLEVYARQGQELAVVDERNRLARELHDSVKQQAFAASAQIAAAHTRLRAANQQHPNDIEMIYEHLGKAEHLMDEIRTELSQLIYELRPVALQEKGLAAALREWGSGWSSQYGIAFNLRSLGERSLPQEIEQALFRITQEALSNVGKHSQARQVSVLLDLQADTVRLTIQDDGIGFDPALVEGGFGLRSMRERAEQLPGGKLEISSLPEQGTSIQICFKG
jgi:two-component system, NarL family, sensor histidine kinase LiaS